MKSKATTKIVFFTTLIAVSAAGFLGYLGYTLSFGAYYGHFVDMKTRFAELCALGLDGDAHARIAETGDTRDPSYADLLAYLGRAKSLDPSITYLYTVAQDESRNFRYVVDAEIAERDIVWVETDSFALECFFDRDGEFLVRFEEAIVKPPFEVSRDGRVYSVEATSANGEAMLYVGHALVAKFRNDASMRVWFTGFEMDSERRERRALLRIGEESVEFTVTVTYAGESISHPGAAYVNTEDNVQRLARAYDAGMTVVDPEPMEDTYGPIMAFRVPIRTSSGALAGLLVLDVSALEVRSISGGIMGTLAWSFLPVVAIMLFLIYFMLRRIIVKPFRALLDGVALVKFGEDDHLIDVRTHDEFESFADAFNALTVSIRENRIRLEETVRERTRALEDALSELKDKSVRLEALARTDEMTGLANKHELIESLDAESARLARYGEKPRITSSLVFIDLDNFKYVNDAFGHAAGDLVLRRFADLLDGSARVCDITGRYGGDEFVVLLPDTHPSGALIYVERVRDMLECSSGFAVDLERFLGVDVSVPKGSELGFSCGVSAFKPGQTTEDVLKRADELLYEAKRLGKGRTVVDPDWIANRP